LHRAKAGHTCSPRPNKAFRHEPAAGERSVRGHYPRPDCPTFATTQPDRQRGTKGPSKSRASRFEHEALQVGSRIRRLKTAAEMAPRVRIQSLPITLLLPTPYRGRNTGSHREDSKYRLFYIH